MKTKITLKELYLQSYNDVSGIRNYPLFKLLCDENHFIFYNLMDTISNNMYDYPLLKAYLSNITAYNQYSGLLPPTNVERSTLLDLLMLQTFGQRKCNNVIDDFRYNFAPFKPQESKYTLFSLELSFMLINRFAERWEKYIEELTLSYNPIHNYDMEEDEKVNTYLETSDDTDKYTNGFNSSTASPTDKSENTIIVDGDWDNNKRNLTRKGNIGVTTSQQMLEAEIKLRDENLVVQRLINDVVDFITLSVY